MQHGRNSFARRKWRYLSLPSLPASPAAAHKDFRKLACGACDAPIFWPSLVDSALTDVSINVLFFVGSLNDAICHVHDMHEPLQQQALILRTPGSLSAGAIALHDARAPERPHRLIAF